MSITKKFALLLLLLVTGLVALGIISARLVAFNDVNLSALKEERLAVLMHARTMEQHFRNYNKDVEIALTTREPQFVENNLVLIQSIKNSAAEALINAAPERKSEIQTLLSQLEQYPEQMTRFVTLNLNSSLSDPEYLKVTSDVIKQKEEIQKSLETISTHSNQDFDEALHKIHDYNNKLAGNMPYVFATAIVVIVALIAPVLIGITTRLRRMGSHFNSTDLHSLSPAEGDDGADELARLVRAYNKMLEKIKSDRAQLVDKEFVDKIIATLANMLLVTDTNGRITRVNDVARRKLQHEGTDLCATNLFDLVVNSCDGQPDQSQVESIATLRNRFTAGQGFKCEIAMAKPSPGSPHSKDVTDGSTAASAIPVLLNVTPMTDQEGNLTGFVCVAADLTERIQIEKERRSMQHQLAHTARLASLGTLGAGVAHELNNPLAAIRGFSEILLRPDSDPEKVKSRAEKIFKATQRMQKIISHLHTFSRTGSPEDWKPLDINLPVRDSLIILEDQLRIRGIETVLELAENLPQVQGDPNQLESVVQNLIANARDAYEENTTETPREILIRTSSIGSDTLRIVVEDQAGGMPAHVRERIFDPFFTTKQVGKGTGLGLSIVHGIIERHGGKISVESNMGKGTRFTIDLPAAIDVPLVDGSLSLPTSLKGVEKAKPNPETTLKNVLVVDDEPLITDLLSLYLEDHFRITALNDPRIAVETFKNGRYDLLITDVKMPHLSGPEIIQQIRVFRPDLPIIVMSGHAAEDIELQQTLTNLSCEFIQKPFESQETILKIISKTLPDSPFTKAA